MDVKAKVLLQLFNKSKLRNKTITFLEPKFFSIVKFKKLEFSAPLNYMPLPELILIHFFCIYTFFYKIKTFLESLLLKIYSLTSFYV